MSPDLANWLGIAWLVGCLSFAGGWWMRGYAWRLQVRKALREQGRTHYTWTTTGWLE